MSSKRLCTWKKGSHLSSFSYPGPRWQVETRSAARDFTGSRGESSLDVARVFNPLQRSSRLGRIGVNHDSSSIDARRHYWSDDRPSLDCPRGGASDPSGRLATWKPRRAKATRAFSCGPIEITSPRAGARLTIALSPATLRRRARGRAGRAARRRLARARTGGGHQCPTSFSRMAASGRQIGRAAGPSRASRLPAGGRAELPASLDACAVTGE